MTIPQRFQSPTYLIAALTILWLLTIGIIWTIMQAIGERWEVGIFFGRFHILVVHLPIGLLLGAAAMEAIRFLPPLKHLSQGVLPMLWLAALGSVMATILGFLLMLADDYQGELIRKHMWTGLGVVVLVALTLWIKLAKFPEKVYLTSLFASVVLISISGHFGGDLVHGKDYLVEYAPGPLGSILNPDSPEEEGTKELAQRLIYGDVIQPVFDAKCVECHFEGKVKGKLRMDSFEELAKGGDYGQEFIPGNANDSELVYRVELDPDEDDFMPPRGKSEPMTPQEILVMRWWIDSGASPTMTVAEGNPTPEVQSALETVIEGIASEDYGKGHQTEEEGKTASLSTVNREA